MLLMHLLGLLLMALFHLLSLLLVGVLLLHPLMLLILLLLQLLAILLLPGVELILLLLVFLVAVRIACVWFGRVLDRWQVIRMGEIASTTRFPVRRSTPIRRRMIWRTGFFGGHGFPP